jgi:beta-glucosidase
MEGAGEDTYLGSKVGVARVKGFQGDDLTDPFTIAATAKHFAGYGFAEAGRDYNTADVGTSTLYNVILPPFQACVDADVKTVMNSFNVLNGIAATGDKFLQRDVLKEKWGFDGFVISDWGSAKEMIAHGFAKDEKHAAILAANAGSDMDMESYVFIQHLEECVNEGSVDMKYIDDAVRRILKVKEDLGLFDDPYKYCDAAREKEYVYHKDFARDALAIAKESIVLLKNEGNLLPLKKEQKKIALIGALADDKTSPLGNWRLGSDDGTAVSVTEAFKAMDINFDYAQGTVLNTNKPEFAIEIKVNETDKSGFDRAISLAKNSEVVVMVVGEHGYQSGEGRSRSKLDLPGLQQELVEAVHAVNPNIVLVVMSGRPLVLDWADKNIPTILQTWQLGTETGNAIASTLFGENNPSGKLVMSFPRSLGQVPLYYNQFNTGRPGPLKDVVFWSHYGDVENTALYPFGYGLSYSSFEYNDLNVNSLNPSDIKVSAQVCNTSSVAGQEVVQLYLRDHVGTVVRPIKELKGFEKVSLASNECKTVNFSLTDKELGFFDNQGKYIVEDGDFDVMVGGDSNASLKSTFTLNKSSKNVEE